jgi:hypothetical protein
LPFFPVHATIRLPTVAPEQLTLISKITERPAIQQEHLPDLSIVWHLDRMSLQNPSNSSSLKNLQIELILAVKTHFSHKFLKT